MLEKFLKTGEIEGKELIKENFKITSVDDLEKKIEKYFSSKGFCLEKEECLSGKDSGSFRIKSNGVDDLLGTIDYTHITGFGFFKITVNVFNSSSLRN